MVGLLRAALFPGMAQRKRRPGTTTPRPVSPWASPPPQPVPRPTAGAGPGSGHAATRADRGAGAPWWGGGRPSLRTELSSGPHAPAAAWGVSCARLRWPPCLRRGPGRGGRGVAWPAPCMPRVRCPVARRAAGAGGGGRGSARPGGGPARPRPCAWCRVSDPLAPSRGLGGIRRPGGCQRRWVAAVGHRDARAPASVPSTPTRACRRRRPASARASLPLSAAPDA